MRQLAARQTPTAPPTLTRFMIAIFRIILVSAAVLRADAAAAQEIAGRITDQTGGALPGVIVDLATPAGEQTTQSDANGAYRFEKVPPRSVELTFRLINFTVVRRTIAVEQSVILNVTLSLSLNADVLVTAPSTF